VSTVYDCARQDTREAGLTAAASVVRAGRLVVFPTDTVYVRSLLDAKGRGAGMPASVLVGSWSTLDGLVQYVPQRARELVEAFWPGGLSMVLPHAPSLAWDLGDTRGTVMVRMPLHPVAIELLREVGPMAQSSANRTGNRPATSAGEAEEQLGDSVGVYLDGGPSGEATPSSIIDLTGEHPVLLREGAITAHQISAVLGMDITPPAGTGSGSARHSAQPDRPDVGKAPENMPRPSPYPRGH
jgi:L-threonylcarbamoyladenylate synthase